MIIFSPKEFRKIYIKHNYYYLSLLLFSFYCMYQINQIQMGCLINVKSFALFAWWNLIIKL